jgi:hypothetical protein
MEFTRFSAGLFVAVLLPGCLPWTREKPRAAFATTGAYTTYTLLPLLDSWRGWLLLFVTLSTAVGWLLLLRQQPHKRSSIAMPRLSLRGKPANVGALALLATAPVTYGIFGAQRAARDVSAALTNDRVSIIISGLLTSVIIGDQLVSFIVTPMVQVIRRQIADKEIPEDVDDLLAFGSYVGWLERTLLFAFLAAGQPAAAALVLTAKSLARVPALENGGRMASEYFLIGTLSSVAVTVLVAMLTRLAIGSTLL